MGRKNRSQMPRSRSTPSMERTQPASCSAATPEGTRALGSAAAIRQTLHEVLHPPRTPASLRPTPGVDGQSRAPAARTERASRLLLCPGETSKRTPTRCDSTVVCGGAGDAGGTLHPPGLRSLFWVDFLSAKNQGELLVRDKKQHSKGMSREVCVNSHLRFTWLGKLRPEIKSSPLA